MLGGARRRSHDTLGRIATAIGLCRRCAIDVAAPFASGKSTHAVAPRSNASITRCDRSSAAARRACDRAASDSELERHALRRCDTIGDGPSRADRANISGQSIAGAAPCTCGHLGCTRMKQGSTATETLTRQKRFGRCTVQGITGRVRACFARQNRLHVTSGDSTPASSSRTSTPCSCRRTRRGACHRR
jgi:hypothetical protein